MNKSWSLLHFIVQALLLTKEVKMTRRTSTCIIVFLLTVTTGSLWFSTAMVGAANLSQSNIEAIAIAHAQRMGLQGTPSTTVSKQITLGEFSARLDPFSRDKSDPSTPVWSVLLKGNVDIKHTPGQSGSSGSAMYDNMWVVLMPGGEVVAWGSRSPGKEIDLNTPPIPLTQWPSSGNETK